ncbi:MAG TPA: helix-turn-helix domain-containing protein [Phenylobacterium sp.]|jgi:predicted DNA-binding transcriptional regulator AlpA
MSHLTAPSARYLRTPDAGRYLGLSRRTLEKHRCYGTGPAYRKIGGLVVYTIEDLQAWADRGLRTSTSQARQAGILPARTIVATDRGNASSS